MSLSLFSNIEDGRLELSVRKLSVTAERTVEAIPGGAPFVTFVRQGGALGLSTPATYVRIPEHRTHAVRLAEDPAQIRIDFAKADHLKIDEIAPPSTRRQLSETRDNTEVLTLFLDRSEGITPQTLTVQFGYFSQLQSWAPILIPFAFFALGNLAAPVFRLIGLRLARAVRARVHVGSPDRVPTTPDGGVVLSDETLARIKPGETTEEEVRALCGQHEEEEQRLGAPGHTLVYRSRRLIPQRKRSWGWISTVDHWELEVQEVGITVEGGLVRDVQARVRRTRLAHPD